MLVGPVLLGCSQAALILIRILVHHRGCLFQNSESLEGPLPCLGFALSGFRLFLRFLHNGPQEDHRLKESSTVASKSAVWGTGSVISLLSAQYWALTLTPSTTQEEGAAVLYTARLPQPFTVMVQDGAPVLGASQPKLCTAAPVLSMFTSPAHACQSAAGSS